LIVRELRRVLTGDRVRLASFVGVPYPRVRTPAGWEDYVPPPCETPVLMLRDLGLAGAAAAGPDVVSGQQAAERGGRLADRDRAAREVHDGPGVGAAGARFVLPVVIVTGVPLRVTAGRTPWAGHPHRLRGSPDGLGDVPAVLEDAEHVEGVVDTVALAQRAVVQRVVGAEVDGRPSLTETEPKPSRPGRQYRPSAARV
jgi:hypothetical protein